MMITLKEKYLEKWSCHSSPMATNLMTPDVEEKKLSTCPEKKMILSMFLNNMNLSLLTDSHINKEALWLLVS